MSDLYQDDGWSVITTVEQLAGGKQTYEAYAVAIKDRNQAIAAIKEILLEGETVYDVGRLPASVMQTFGLLPGKIGKMRVFTP